MDTYYAVLGINQEATAIEIKKAYFSMIRKNTPEREPEKFMEIRHAYESLSNEKMRAQYDEWMNMPLYVQVSLDEAKIMFEQGNLNRAIRILEQLQQEVPEILMIQSLLGEFYMHNDNPGKAIKIFTELVGVDPENPSFVGNLGQAYLVRGWHKKALETLKQAVSLDPDNFWLWIGLSEAYLVGGESDKSKEVLQRSLSTDQGKESFAFPIYFKILIIDIEELDLEAIKESLEKVYEMAATMEDEKEGIAWTLLALANRMVDMQVFDIAEVILDKALQLSPQDESIKQLKDLVDVFCKTEGEFSSLEMDDDYDDDFVGFIASRILPAGVMDEEIYVNLVEYSFLKEFHAKEKYIFMLEQEYPKIYHELKEYFEKVRNKRKRTKRINEIERFLTKNQKQVEMFMMSRFLERAEGPADYFDDHRDCEECCDNSDEWYGQYAKQEPYVNAEAKIGRNNPCPCGSGKKYKKCCYEN
ncbi:MAG TPA: tetratricopeptide repeat protein [Epulopiscium sp.]|nr:tetratricopeptide repeat protein [Candidatus Epulonipiscium sp.]